MKIIFDQSCDYQGYTELMSDRSGFQRAFTEWILADQLLRSGGGRVLDIGCGSNLPGALEGLKGRYVQLDGVDPDIGVMTHPLLTCRYYGNFEDSEIPTETYDLAYAYNVIEHIANARPFFRKVRSVLKPGGVFWALTPHANHPFALLAKTVEFMGGKGYMRDSLKKESGAYTVNDYPAYYRLNRSRNVLQAINDLGFASVIFRYYPCMQWDTYFPQFLRWVPNGYDYLLGTRFKPCMLIFAFRLEAGWGS